MSIEPAEGGFIVTCEYDSKSSSGEISYSEPVKKVASDLDQLYTILKDKLQ